MKEPPTASRALRKKPSATAVAPQKLKLFCSFNGAFHLRPPYHKLRYIGGDTRVVTVDRNVTFSKLLMKISDLCPNLKSFSLKYKLLVSNSDWDPPLVSIESDDDVKCMIEDFYKLELYVGHARLWLFVCSHSCNNGDKNKSSWRASNCNGKGNNGIRCSLRIGNNGVGENRQRCGYDLPLIDLMTELSDAFFMDVRDQCFEGSAVEHGKGNGKLNSGESFGNFVNYAVAPRAHPLNPRDGNLLPERNDLMHCLPGQNSGNYNDLCNSHVVSMCNGVNDKQEVCNNGQPSMNNLNRENILPWGMSNPWSYSSKFNGSIYPVKTTSACQRVSGGNQNCIRHHRFGLNEVRNHQIHPCQIRSQKNMVELGKGNHQAVCLDARLSAGRYSGLRPNSSIAKLVRPMRLYVSSHSKPDFPDNVTEKRPSAVKLGLHDASGLTVEQTSCSVSKSGNSYSTEYHLGCHAVNPVANQSLVCENVSESVALPVGAIETQHDHLTGSHPLMHEISCQSASQDYCGVPMNTKPLMFVQKKKNGISDFLDHLCPSIETTQECNEKLINRREGYNYTRCSNNDGDNLHGGVASSVDLLYNLSLSSSKEVKAPGVSSLASNGASNTLLKSEIKPSNLINKAKVGTSPKSEKPAAVTSDPLSQCGPNMEKDCVPEEEIQHGLPSGLIIDEQAEAKDSIKGSKVIGGIFNGLAGFYTHLATKELQAIKYSDLEFIKELGSGTYGTVYHGKWKGSDVAIKKLKPSCFTNGSLEEDRLVTDFWKEAHILGQLHHPNIVAFYGVVRDGPNNDLATVNEYMVNGSLKQVLRRKDRTIDRRKRLRIAMDAAFGIEYLHEKNIVHFDLKSHNLLVNMKDPQRPTCKIGDLGLSKIKQRTLVSGGVRGTIPWMSPELLNSKSNMVTEKVDVYSFGVVLWELLTGEEPYANLRSEEIIAGIIKGTLRPEIPSWCDPAWRSLMVRCWSSDPNDRPAFSEIAKELRATSAAMNFKQ